MFGFGRGRGRGRECLCVPKECMCINCGHVETVPPGKPCRFVKCPKCGAPMVRHA